MKIVRTIIITMTILVTGSALGEPLAISPASQQVNAGYFTLSFPDDTNTSDLTLQVSTQQSFATIDKTMPLLQQSAITLTGFADGEFFIRLVNDQQQTVSTVAQVQVSHHPLSLALGLFFVGLLLFVGLVITILHAQKQ